MAVAMLRYVTGALSHTRSTLRTHGPHAGMPSARLPPRASARPRPGGLDQRVEQSRVGTLLGVPLDRQNPRATLSSFKRLLPLLQDRAYVVLFPEGTYVQGKVGPGKHRLIQMLLKLHRRDGLGPLPFVPEGLRSLGGLWSAPLAGYGCAWIGHFFFEHNRPATFSHPIYSLIGDWAMFRDILRGRIRL